MKTLKQPQLGQSIVTLRQRKSLTQEELVELCNINVRTLQRIEAGEVTPRDYTIRIILDALDYDFDQVESSINRKSMIKGLQFGWIAGIIYFILVLFEAKVDYARFEDGLSIYFPFIYITIKAVVVCAYTFFMLGFVEVGKYFQSPLLKISSFLMMGSMFIIELYDIISVFSECSLEEFYVIKGSQAVMFGGIDIVFGIALFKLGNELGNISRVGGVFEILAGACFVTFILALMGLVLLIPATILEVIILYKCLELLKQRQVAKI